MRIHSFFSNIHIPTRNIHIPTINIHIPIVNIHIPTINIHIPTINIHIPTSLKLSIQYSIFLFHPTSTPETEGLATGSKFALTLKISSSSFAVSRILCHVAVACLLPEDFSRLLQYREHPTALLQRDKDTQVQDSSVYA